MILKQQVQFGAFLAFITFFTGCSAAGDVPLENDITGVIELFATLEESPDYDDEVQLKFCAELSKVSSVEEHYSEEQANVVCAAENCFIELEEGLTADGLENDSAFVSAVVPFSHTWEIPIGSEGIYSVAVHIPKSLKTEFSDAAQYTIEHKGGSSEITITQRVEIPEWIELGMFPGDSDSKIIVKAQTMDETKPIVIDDIMLVKQSDYNLQNSAWLSYMAANVYSDPSELYSLAESLGFMGTEESEYAQNCESDIRKIRQFNNEQDLSECYNDWLSTFQKDEKSTSTAELYAAFHQWKRQSVDPTAHVQFFSDGAFGPNNLSFVENSTQFLWMHHPIENFVWVIFRGTEMNSEQRFEDATTDLKIKQISLSDYDWNESWGEAHGGFTGAYTTIRKQLLEKSQALDADSRIWLAGHSLGASLATLATADLMQQKETGLQAHVSGLYTYGSPRVGNHQFRDTFHRSAARYDVSLLRTRNNRDPVTTIPFSSLILLDYHHVGPLLFIDEDKNLIVAPDKSHEKIAWSAKDHDKITYYEVTKAAAANIENKCE